MVPRSAQLSSYINFNNSEFQTDKNLPHLLVSNYSPVTPMFCILLTMVTVVSKFALNPKIYDFNFKPKCNKSAEITF